VFNYIKYILIDMKFETITELIVALTLWITTHTNYPEPENQIIIESISQESLSELACGRPCEIMAYTPINEKGKIYLINELDPLNDVCHQGILLHEIIHVIQEETNYASNYENKTKKHLREMNALVNHNIFLSQYGKKILYSNGFAAKLKKNSYSKNDLYC